MQDRRVHEHDVCHRHECSQASQDFGPPVGCELLELEVALESRHQRANHWRRASISTARARRAASVPDSETSCRPSGSPRAGIGMEIAGTPRAVHGAFMTGSPVDSSPAGAAPGAAGVISTGYWRNRLLMSRLTSATVVSDAWYSSAGMRKPPSTS